jgi:competence ComEA-like helix-hairpin-helix protein
MSSISLRAYVREIESMIDQGRIEESIAHCKQVLSRFPKHIEIYRLLGKTYLENNQNSNAADIFQRVLSAIPDDFVSHVGMSLIREEEGNLISAVEHMERAFERQPYNNAIQEELRRLYGKRDGIEPAKVRLTQGALARIYLKGDLVSQGIAELHSAIAENPERYDLKTILAEAYANSGEMAKAIDTASDILKKYPFNISANRILANALKTTDHPKEMAICRKRLFALSPYEAYISKHAPSLDQVPDRAITLEKISWSGDPPSFRTRTREDLPSWSKISESSAAAETIQSKSKEIPDWLKSNPQEDEALMPEENQFNSNSDENEERNQPSNQDENIPDWMKDAGWEPSDGTVDESKPAFDDLEDLEDLDEEGELAPAEIPAWLEEAAPTGVFDSIPDEAKEEEPVPDFLAGDLDDGFQIHTADLQSLPEESNPTDQEPSPSVDENLDQPETYPSSEGEEIPSWLKNLELDEDSQETAIAWLENMPEELFEEGKEEIVEPPAEQTPDLTPLSEISGNEEEKDFLSELSGETTEPAITEDIPASDLLPEEEEELIFDQSEISASESQLPSWLDELEDDRPVSSEPDSEKRFATRDEIHDVVDATQSTVAEPSDQESEDIPDWLSSFEEQAAPDNISEPKLEEDPLPSVSDEIKDQELIHSEPDQDELPDWLDGLGQDSDFGEPDTPDFSTSDGGLDWLDSLGEEQEQNQADPSSLDDQKTEDVPAAGEDLSDQSGPDDLPDWLSSLEESESTETEPEQAEPATSHEDITLAGSDDETLNTKVPDWLAGLDQEPGSTTPETADSMDPSGPDDDWLDRIEEQPLDDYPEDEVIQEEPRDIPTSTKEDESPAWSEELAEDLVDPEAEGEVLDHITEAQEAVVADSDEDDMPSWLSELGGGDEEESLADAIEYSDHELSEEELAYLEKSKPSKEAEWLSELDLEEQQEVSSGEQPPAESVISPEDTSETEEVSSSMLERFKSDQLTPKEDEEPEITPEVPQWLENLKREEDPQETAILWLQQFVRDGDKANLQQQIKRYTDELDPGDSIPDWMEDLKREEDPQTTAMLWLEKLENERDQTSAPRPSSKEPDDSGWLAELEKEEAMREEQTSAAGEDQLFEDEASWLADLDEESDTSDEEKIPSWAKSDSPEGEGEYQETADTPPWMKATSPLEGDFFTDELEAGSEKETEIPEWLAGYTAEELAEQEKEKTSPAEDRPAPEEETVSDEYGWFSTDKGSAKKSSEPLDINKAAISQLESIIGISYQVAKGIVTYREKHGPYHELEDLLSVPEITDRQTIEILKPEIRIDPFDTSELDPETVSQTDEPVETATADTAVQEKTSEAQEVESQDSEEPTKQVEPSAKSSTDPLSTARDFQSKGDIEAALESYQKALSKKDFTQEVINDLKDISQEHPLNILVAKTLGDAYMKADMLQEALDAYSKAEDLLQ